MVGEPGKKKKKTKQPGKLKYFYLQVDGERYPQLHKSLHINRGQDTISTWCYPLAKRITYAYSYTKKYRDPAFTTQETGKMLNRGILAIERGILKGGITPPQFTYGLNENRKKYQYLWHERDIINAHEYFSNLHYGAPRKDGKITPWPALPTVRELRAMIRQEAILYVKNEEGEFVPTWKAN